MPQGTASCIIRGLSDYSGLHKREANLWSRYEVHIYIYALLYMYCTNTVIPNAVPLFSAKYNPGPSATAVTPPGCPRQQTYETVTGASWNRCALSNPQY